jgi:hypothetical protein
MSLMINQGWIMTYGADEKMDAQLSFASEGGSGTPVPDISIEVDDLEEVLERRISAGIEIVYGPVQERWEWLMEDPSDERLLEIAVSQVRSKMLEACTISSEYRTSGEDSSGLSSPSCVGFYFCRH